MAVMQVEGGIGSATGGEGATMRVSVPISETSDVQPGDILRFIPGEVGGTDTGLGDRGAGGGGSSGVWYLCSGCNPTNSWKAVAVGGGGGGARVSFASADDYPGGGGQTDATRTSNGRGFTNCGNGGGGAGLVESATDCYDIITSEPVTIGAQSAVMGTGGSCELSTFAEPKCIAFGGDLLNEDNGGDDGGTRLVRGRLWQVLRWRRRRWLPRRRWRRQQ